MVSLFLSCRALSSPTICRFIPVPCPAPIGLAFSVVEKVCANVKRWHGGDQRERWVGSGLLVAESQFRRVKGYKQIPLLLRELDALAPPQAQVAKRRKAS